MTHTQQDIDVVLQTVRVLAERIRVAAAEVEHLVDGIVAEIGGDDERT